MINGVLYTVTGLGFIAALDPATGATRWLYKDERYQEGKPPNGVGYAVRGLGYLDGRECGAALPRHIRRLHRLDRCQNGET